MLRLLEEKIATPLGPLWVVCDEQFRLRAIEWEQYRDRMEQLLNIHYRHEGYERLSATNPGGLSDKLADYFAGNLAVIDTLETATGGTPFQREVWQALRAIPCGTMVSWRRNWDDRAPHAQSVLRMALTPSVLLFPAIASSGVTAL